MGSTEQARPVAWAGDRVRFEGAEHTVTGLIEYEQDWGYQLDMHTVVREVTPTGEVDWQVRYDALVAAVVDEATDAQWCREFEQVMRDNGFEDVACGRTKTYDVDVRLTYELNAYRLDEILNAAFGGRHDVRDEVEVVSQVAVKVTTLLSDPSDLEDSDDLADALKAAGYKDWESIEITSMDED